MNYRYAVIKKYYTDRFLPFFRTRNHISFNAVKSPENRERLPVFAILTRRNKKNHTIYGAKNDFSYKNRSLPARSPRRFFIRFFIRRRFA